MDYIYKQLQTLEKEECGVCVYLTNGNNIKGTITGLGKGGFTLYNDDYGSTNHINLDAVATIMPKVIG
jgi:sRNA-binding regulator protein Hfq